MKIKQFRFKASHLTLLLGLGFVAIAVNPWAEIDHQARTSLGVAGIGVLAGPTGELERRLDQNNKTILPLNPKHESEQ